MSDAMAARFEAFRLLKAVLRRRQPLDDALADRDFCSLEPRDRAFARNLAATSLRHLGEIDAVIDICLEKPLPHRANAARDVLRLGVAQLLFLQTPAFAAVDTSVSLAEALDQGFYKKLVNAILRRVGREGEAMRAELDAPRLNTPDWLWQSWEKAYGQETCRRIAAAHMLDPPLDISLKGDAVPWAERLEAKLLPTGSLRREGGGRVDELPGFAEGAWWVQDAAAALPARLLGNISGREVIDLCAAPGGKTAQLAAMGAAVVAIDRSKARLKRLQDNLRRLGLKAEAVFADAAAWRPGHPVDAVLLDAPCSSTGTIRRHPDVAWLKTPADVAGLAATQARLLDATVPMLRQGGVLVYCTCSLQPEEGPERVAEFLGRHPEMRREVVTPEEIPGLEEAITKEGDVRTLPCHLAGLGGLDGFYMARLRRP